VQVGRSSWMPFPTVWPSELGIAHVREADRLLNALGDPNRRAMVGMLAAGPSTVSQIATSLQITLTGAGQHLAVLQDCGLVRSTKSGRVRVCQLNPEGFAPLESWIKHHQLIWSERLDQLGILLDE